MEKIRETCSILCLFFPTLCRSGKGLLFKHFNVILFVLLRPERCCMPTNSGCTVPEKGIKSI